MQTKKKKTLQYSHLFSVLQSDPRMDFLLSSGQFKADSGSDGRKDFQRAQNTLNSRKERALKEEGAK